MKIEVNGLSELDEAAKRLLKATTEAKIYLFYGDMGAGKTTFIKSVCKSLGVEENVSSPTFSIVNEYVAHGKAIYHFDFYRINSIREAFDMGYEEYLYSGNICLIEWPEKIQELLPEHHVRVDIEILNEHKRIVNFELF